MPILHGLTSEQFVNNHVPLPISYAFIDSGEHSKESIKIETDYLKNHTLPGSLIIFHDYGNQFTATTYALRELVDSEKFEEIKIDWEPIFAFVDTHRLEIGNNSWHWLNHPHPNFIGVIRRKGIENVAKE
mgnify:FL=1